MAIDQNPAAELPELPAAELARIPAAELPEIVVAMATFRRPDCLARILPELVRQVSAYPGVASVLVVDNDPDAGARAQVAEWADQGVRYVSELTPGIAAARNRALAEAGTAELLLFIDDDGLPLDGWVANLVARWLQWRCAGVSGPVIPTPEGGEPDAWVVSCGVLDRVKLPTGTKVRGAGTGNLLLCLPQLRELRLCFDENFGLTGGSDTMLTHDLIRRGGVIRWCDEAEVYDFLTVDRLTRPWVLRRCRRTGNDWSRVALALAPSPLRKAAERMDLTARGLLRIAQGLARQLVGLVRGRIADRARGACAVATGLGVISGAVGFVHVEYARPKPA